MDLEEYLRQISDSIRYRSIKEENVKRYVFQPKGKNIAIIVEDIYGLNMVSDEFNSQLTIFTRYNNHNITYESQEECQKDYQYILSSLQTKCIYY